MSDSKDLEILVQKIQAQLAPDAVVTHNVKLPGKRSGTQRQIDVLVSQQIGQYEMRVAIDCKDYATPVDVKGVEEFHGLVTDVAAHRGALVSPKGFSKAAKTTAANLGIDLYSPVDTDPHKWQAKVSAPVICDFRSAAISFGISMSAPLPMRMPPDFYNVLEVHDSNKKSLGTPADAAIEKWNNGGYPTDVGEHKNLPLFDTKPVTVDNGYGTQAPVDLYVGLYVTRQLYFGNIPITKISGFKDELSGAVITNAFTTGIFDPDDVEKNWQKINSESDVKIPVLIRLQGLVGWAK